MCWDELLEAEQQTGAAAPPLPAAPPVRAARNAAVGSAACLPSPDGDRQAQAGQPAVERTVLPSPTLTKTGAGPVPPPAERLECVAAAADS